MPTVSFIKSFLAISAFFAATAIAAPIEERAADVTTFAAPAGTKKFHLMVLPAGADNTDYEGTWVTSFHTGAGTSVTTLTYNQSQALDWQFHKKTGDISFLVSNDGNPYPMSIGFDDASPYMSSAPAGYKLVTANAGYANSSFSFNQQTNVALNPAGHGYMAACYVNGTAPYFSVGPQLQLLWRPESVAKGNCSDVVLKAVDKS